MEINEQISGAFFKPIKGVYKIANLVTGRIYIGQSMEAQNRLSSHFKDLGRGKHPSTQMQDDWLNHGADSFTAEILEYVADKDQRLLREAEIIADTIGGGLEVYNTSIISPESIKANIKARKAKRSADKEAAKEKQTILDVKKQARVKANDQEETRRHPSDKKAVRRKNDLYRSGHLFEPQPSPSLERDQQELRVPQVDLRPGPERVDRTAETERPPAASVDEDRLPTESNFDFEEALPRSGEDSYIENELGKYIGYDNVSDYQWETDSRHLIESIEDQENTPTTIEWFLRTYVRHELLRSIVSDLDNPLIYINLEKGPEWAAELIHKYMPGWKLVLKTLQDSLE